MRQKGYAIFIRLVSQPIEQFNSTYFISKENSEDLTELIILFENKLWQSGWSLEKFIFYVWIPRRTTIKVYIVGAIEYSYLWWWSDTMRLWCLIIIQILEAYNFDA